MAKTEILIQQFVESDNHEKAILEVLDIKHPLEFIFCSAFLVENGITNLKGQLTKVAPLLNFYIGMRNGVTSIQGVKSLLELKCKVYLIDTATNMAIFHPKLYCGYNKTEAKLLVGSANMTFAGQNNNIESSIFSKLDLSDKDDAKLLKKIKDTILSLDKKFPEHVILVKDVRQLVELKDQGLLIDERRQKIDSRGKVTDKGEAVAGSKRRIKLQFKTPPKLKSAPKKKATKSTKKKVVSSVVVDPELVWYLPELKRRHLQIPGPRTNKTGSLSLTQARFNGIDQTKYFRYEAFANLKWKKDARNPQKELSKANFEVIVSGVSYGKFNLAVSYDPRFESGQRNYTTSIHWGEVEQYIADPNLLGRGLALYRLGNSDDEYIIEID